MKNLNPLNYFGGKFYMAKDIINLFPPHKIYTEVFGGSGHIIIQKPPSSIDVYNDIDNDLILFFRVLRDKPQELQKSLQLTPYSRKEFKDCQDWKEEKNEIERVRKWYVNLMQSYSKTIGSKGWSHSKTITRRGMSQCVSQWLRKIDENLPDVVERLREIQIENLDYKDLIKKYDGKETLFYMDPPYIHNALRKMTFEYTHEMDDNEHKNLVEILLQIKGKVLLSGYDNNLYNKLEEKGWKKILLGEYNKRSSSHNHEKGIGKELLWMNYEIKEEGSLFDKE